MTVSTEDVTVDVEAAADKFNGVLLPASTEAVVVNVAVQAALEAAVGRFNDVLFRAEEDIVIGEVGIANVAVAVLVVAVNFNGVDCCGGAPFNRYA